MINEFNVGTDQHRDLALIRKKINSKISNILSMLESEAEIEMLENK